MNKTLIQYFTYTSLFKSVNKLGKQNHLLGRVLSASRRMIL